MGLKTLPARVGRADFCHGLGVSGRLDRCPIHGPTHVTNGYSAEEHSAAAADAEARGDFEGAMRLAGAALNVSDSSSAWDNYARMLLLAANSAGGNQAAYLDRAYKAAVNGYLRASSPAEQHHGSGYHGRCLGKGGGVVIRLRRCACTGRCAPR